MSCILSISIAGDLGNIKIVTSLSLLFKAHGQTLDTAMQGMHLAH